MKTLEKISDFVGKYMAIIVLVIAAMALFVPTSLSWVKTSWVNYLLMVVTAIAYIGLLYTFNISLDLFKYMALVPMLISAFCIDLKLNK